MTARDTIHTTLYDLIEAIGEVVPEGEEDLVTATVLDLMYSGRLKFLRDISTEEMAEDETAIEVCA
jgi:hypothetical protein